MFITLLVMMMKMIAERNFSITDSSTDKWNSKNRTVFNIMISSLMWGIWFDINVMFVVNS